MKLLLRHKIIGLASFSVLVTVLTLSLLFIVEYQSSEQQIKKELNTITDEHLRNSVLDIYGLCQVSNDLIQQQVNKSLNAAQKILTDSGGFKLSKDKNANWEGINQYTKKSTPIVLPHVEIGDQLLEQNDSFDKETPVIDEVEKLASGTCTIFQRMNEAGDMLRIATNVHKLNGKRAIGTFIPAINPDGTPNPVIHKVVNEKQTYLGRAYVVNDWYLTAYKPIFDENKRVIGILYVGARQEPVDSLRKAITQRKIGKNGYSWIMYGKDKERSGKFVLMQENPFHLSNNAHKLKNDAGQNFFEKIRLKAIKLPLGKIDSNKVNWKPFNNKAQSLNLYYAYFPQWDWIIGITAFTEDFQKPQMVVNSIFRDTFNGLITALIILFIIMITVSTLFGKVIAKPITISTSIARAIAKGDLATANQIINEQGSDYHEKLKRATDETGELYRSIVEMLNNLQKITNSMQTTARQLKNSAKEIGGTARLQESAVQDFSTSSTQIGIAVQEIDSTAKELSKTMQTVSQSTDKTVQLAGGGRKHLKSMHQGVQNLINATQSISKKLSEITERTQNINQIVTTIVKVADQTNLLSLNAAIEAEKAGELGLGFAVVAKEIRRLADQTAEATLDIETMVFGMQNSVDAGVIEMDRFNETVHTDIEMIEALGKQMESIIEQVEALSPQFEVVQKGMDAQATGASQISQATISLNTAAKQTQTSLEGFNKTITQLNIAIQEIEQSTQQLKTGENDEVPPS